MKNKRTFPEGRTLAEQYAYEATLISESSMEILHEIGDLDPHLLGEYDPQKQQKRQYLQARFLNDIELAGTDSADMATELENLDPELIN